MEGDILDSLVEGLGIPVGQPVSVDRPIPKLSNKFPDELKILMLQSQPDLAALRSFVQSSPDYRANFNTKRHEILSSITRLLDMQPEILTDALAVKDAEVAITHRFGTSDWLTQADQYSQDYQFSRQFLPAASRYDGAGELNYLHSIVDDLTRDFTSRVLSKHSVSGEKMKNIDGISKGEIRRLHRALYRVELFYKLFPFRIPLSDFESFEISESIDRFEFFRSSSFSTPVIFPRTDFEERKDDAPKEYLSIFEPYEAEEIACVHDYICEVYAEAFDDANTKSNQMYINGYMTLGLEGLHKVLGVSSQKAKHKLLKKHALENVSEELVSTDWLGKALDGQSRHVYRNTDKYRKWYRSDILFANDDGTGPNAAWVWSTGGEYEFEYFQAKKRLMRSWGYVFWDKKRLDQWKVLDIKRRDAIDMRIVAELIGKEYPARNGEHSSISGLRTRFREWRKRNLKRIPFRKDKDCWY